MSQLLQLSDLQISWKIRVTFEVILQQSAVKTRSRDVKKLKNNTSPKVKNICKCITYFNVKCLVHSNHISTR